MGGSPSIKSPPPAPATPTPLDPSVLEARRRARTKNRGVRADTLLTGPQGAMPPMLSRPGLLGGSAVLGQS